MSRRHVTFRCEGSELAGTLDDGPSPVGLLWLSGGNEIRAGAFCGLAQLSARIAAAGYPVFRFDRRGVGDSDGVNLGFRESGPDIAAALACLRSEWPGLLRIVAFGNCDAASALMLTAGAGCDALVLANPWTIDDDGDDTLPPAAIRARYAGKARDAKELARLITGQISLRKLAKGLLRAARPAPQRTSLARQVESGLAAFKGRVRLLVAERDRTGQAFLAGWNASDPRLARCRGASHAFVEPAASDWLFQQLLGALHDEQARQLDVS